MSYQTRDWEIVDYQEFRLERANILCRGPRPESLEPGAYFSCVGAAQTFGCFCQRPFPTLLSEKLRLPVLNLGFAGPGPVFFLDRDELINYINDSRFTIIQVLSGRSESNHLFDSGGLEYLTRRSDGIRIGADAAYGELMETSDAEELKSLVAETRHNWVRHYLELLEKIKAPKILFWFSKREPAYRDGYDHLHQLFGEFPQLVNAEMIEEIRKGCDAYIECVTQRGSPQLLTSRFTGKPTSIDYGDARKDLSSGHRETHNAYYPSPEMHEDAASALHETCTRLAGGKDFRGWLTALNPFRWMAGKIE